MKYMCLMLALFGVLGSGNSAEEFRRHDKLNSDEVAYDSYIESLQPIAVASANCDYFSSLNGITYSTDMQSFLEQLNGWMCGNTEALQELFNGIRQSLKLLKQISRNLNGTVLRSGIPESDNTPNMCTIKQDMSTLFVGTNSELSVYEQDSDNVFSRSSSASSLKTSFMIMDQDNKYLYAMVQVDDDIFAIQRFLRDSTTGRLSLDKTIYKGEDCQSESFSLDPSGNYLLISCLGSGLVTVAKISATSVSNDNDEKSWSHVLYINNYINNHDIVRPSTLVLHPKVKNWFAVIYKLMAKVVFFYFDVDHEKNVFKNLIIELPKDSMPRSMVFSPNGNFLYVITDKSCKVVAFQLDGGSDTVPFQKANQLVSLDALPDSEKYDRYYGDSAGIVIHPNGQFLYTVIYGREFIGKFKVDQSSGTLTPMGFMEVDGRSPTHVTMTPDGARLFLTNYASRSIDVYCVDSTDGSLTKQNAITDFSQQPLFALYEGITTKA